MPYFSHIETGIFQDVREAKTVETYRAQFEKVETSGWRIVAVEGPAVEGTPAPMAEKHPVAMTAADFADYCYATFGALIAPKGTPQEQLVAGITRRGKILLACKNTEDPATFEAYTRFMQATTYQIDAVAMFLAIIGPSPGSEITTQEESDAIIGGWPKQ